MGRELPVGVCLLDVELLDIELPFSRFAGYIYELAPTSSPSGSEIVLFSTADDVSVTVSVAPSSSPVRKTHCCSSPAAAVLTLASETTPTPAACEYRRRESRGSDSSVILLPPVRHPPYPTLASQPPQVFLPSAGRHSRAYTRSTRLAIRSTRSIRSSASSPSVPSASKASINPSTSSRTSS